MDIEDVSLYKSKCSNRKIFLRCRIIVTCRLLISFTVDGFIRHAFLVRICVKLRNTDIRG